MKMLLLFFVLSVSGFSLQEVDFHEFHLSKCDINYSKDESALQISLRIFIDDLEEAIAKVQHEENLKLCTNKEVANADSILITYLSDNFIVKVDNQDRELSYVGKEVSEDLLAVWCYFEIAEVLPKEAIQVENKILIETFDDQSNVVSLKYSNDKKEYFLLKKGETSGTLQLN